MGIIVVWGGNVVVMLIGGGILVVIACLVHWLAAGASVSMVTRRPSTEIAAMTPACGSV